MIQNICYGCLPCELLADKTQAEFIIEGTVMVSFNNKFDIAHSTFGKKKMVSFPNG